MHIHTSSLMLLRVWWERYANNDTHNQPTNIVLGNGKTEEERERENERGNEKGRTSCRLRQTHRGGEELR